ncbi:HAD family hydrolase [Mycobacterium hubeiense]|uniref:HAD family hydrolase n=1 Tax=Mycobacterium hubeiense TaxID=1867256 RepID=UPI000C7EE70B|nr:HAD family hydrolase [Mycobacterium sp. QGD 101]
MPSTQERTWRAGRFWWDCPRPDEVSVYPVRAVILDLDALTDLECDGHRVVFNAAFAAHGLPIRWSVPRYRQLLTLRDERQRVVAELRKRCVGTECDVLTEMLADEICATKAMMFEEMILDVGLAPRQGLVDLVMDAFAAGIPVCVVTRGRRSWAEALVRQLVGDGLVETIVTADDVMSADPTEAYQLALRELGVSPQQAIAISGSAAGLRTATSAGLATILVGGDVAAPRDVAAAAAIRADYAGAEPLGIATCERLLTQWWTSKPAKTPSAA